jgi:uncharacterized phage protein (TIGR01671 family)
MRDIKYRGKAINTNQWVYGYVCGCVACTRFEKNFNISGSESGNIVVKNSTIGQFVGLKDRKLIEIYEGDELGVLLECDYCEDEHCECGWQEENMLTGVVEYVDGSFVLTYEDGMSDPLSEFAYGADVKGVLDNIKIIGNVYERGVT